MGYLQALGLKPVLFVDNTERNVQAAVQSDVAIQSKYHFDRKASGLLVPEQKDGYVRIASLDQMKELRQ